MTKRGQNSRRARRARNRHLRRDWNFYPYGEGAPAWARWTVDEDRGVWARSLPGRNERQSVMHQATVGVIDETVFGVDAVSIDEIRHVLGSKK